MIPDTSFIWTFLLTETLVAVQLLIHADFHLLHARHSIPCPRHWTLKSQHRIFASKSYHLFEV